MKISYIRNLLKKWPVAYEAGALAKLLYNLTFSDHSTGELGFLRSIGENNQLAVDVGANRGQTIVRLAKLLPTWSIVAFEPNPHCVRHLSIVKRIIGKRVTVHHVGLSDAEGEADYFEPMLGSVHVAAEGSFEPANFDRSMRERIGGDYEMRQLRLPLRTLDSYGLEPAFVKIDVQGLEHKVLKGMTATLTRTKPVLFIERSDLNRKEIEAILHDLGYVEVTGYPGAEADLLFVHPQSKHRVKAGGITGDKDTDDAIR